MAQRREIGKKRSDRRQRGLRQRLQRLQAPLHRSDEAAVRENVAALEAGELDGEQLRHQGRELGLQRRARVAENPRGDDLVNALSSEERQKRYAHGAAKNL